MPNEDYGYGAFSAGIDTTLMGNATYQQVLGFDCPFPYPNTTNYVFTRSVNSQDTEHVNFISGNIVEFVRELTQQEGKDIWLIGGGEINRLLLENDLIDKLILTLIPTMLGTGIPLFKNQAKETKFELVESKPYKTGLVKLTLGLKK